MKAGLTNEQKLGIGRLFRQVSEAWEPHFQQTTLYQFARDRDALVDALKAHKQATVNWDEVSIGWQQVYANAGDEWRSAFIPMMQGVIEAQCTQYALAFGFTWDTRLLFAEAWFNDYVMTFANEVIGQTERELAELLQQAQREGWSIPTTQEHMEQIFRQWMDGDLTPEAFDWIEQRMPAFRRELIARTELIRSAGRGINELFKQWGVEYKEWLATEDDRTCDWCMAMNGKIIPVGATFWEQGSRMSIQVGDVIKEMLFNYEAVTSPPLHPNCRCCLLPWKEEWARL